ncbi:MAG: FAD-binding oxidoreductase [Telmatospirillum sp.]|nr:FAD-binding oxidoreductase [Telmatospirillum sp.]
MADSLSKNDAARLAQFRQALGTIAYSDDPQTLKAMSRDWSAVSPLLRKSLRGRVADALVAPTSREEIVAIVKAAVAHGIKLIARGGGTANYGQSVPLDGGVLVDFRGFSGIVDVTPTHVRARAGTNMEALDAELRKHGLELRIHPSTRHASTLSGFIAGGSGGIGSIRYGLLRDRGNISAIELLSIEAEPQTVELRGKATGLAHHAYGTNGLITEIELPLAPAWEWRETVFAFPDFASALACGARAGSEDALLLKVLSLQESPIPQWMPTMAGIVPAGHTMLSAMVAKQHRDELVELAEEFGGKLASDAGEGQGPYGEPLYKFCYGHSLAQVQKGNPKFTSVQTLFAGADLKRQIGDLHPIFAGRLPFRLEFQKSQGRLVAVGSPLFVYESEAQMAAIVAQIQAGGGQVANSHTTSVRAVGMKVVSDADIAFVRRMDPHGLLNPGKIDLAADETDALKTGLATSGWHVEERSERASEDRTA